MRDADIVIILSLIVLGIVGGLEASASREQAMAMHALAKKIEGSSASPTKEVKAVEYPLKLGVWYPILAMNFAAPQEVAVHDSRGFTAVLLWIPSSGWYERDPITTVRTLTVTKPTEFMILPQYVHEQ